MRSLIFLKILPRKSPEDTSQTCEGKSCTSCAKDISGDVPTNDIEDVLESTEKLFNGHTPNAPTRFRTAKML